MPADIFIYALVAGGLVFWLRNILGTRHGEERERPNPFIRSEDAEEEKTDNTIHAQEPSMQALKDIIDVEIVPSGVSALSGDLKHMASIENKTAENAIIDMAEADESFNINHFVQGAAGAFPMIVEAYAQGDLDTLKDLLAPDVYKAFEGAIKQREKDQETLDIKIHAIRKAEIIYASLDEDMKAFVTVRFVADETRIHKDKDGAILSGEEKTIAEMIDIWTFGRRLKNDDPRWLVYETRSDDAHDNDIVPNTK